jgi:hypothetical protein
MESVAQNSLWFFVIIMLWTLPWKGYSLWTSARMGHKKWFIALIILNTLAILDIFYIFYIAKKSPKDFLKALKTKL